MHFGTKNVNSTLVRSLSKNYVKNYFLTSYRPYDKIKLIMGILFNLLKMNSKQVKQG